ncbi:MAG: hypothetical protein DHS20C14_22580 [Phycisphaeraceae bacterium]|nr:MAG: hypothetical protein DHS20C14_22580 [Phycisphaeraceae bacterium]
MIEMRYEAGMRVRVTQQVVTGRSVTSTAVEGEVVRAGQQKTGSWFAHSLDKKLWVDRVELRKDDGELITLNLDQNSRVETLGAADATA